MRIVYCGTSDFGIPCLDAIKTSRHELIHIITQPARQSGRGRKVLPTAVAQWAADNSIGYTESENVNTDQIISLVGQMRPDIFVVIAFGQKIGEDFISIAPHRAINVHGSLLPAYRGAAPVNRAVMNGDKETGVTIITLAQRMDAGEMLGKASIMIGPEDTAEIVHDKLAGISAPLLLETLDQIESGKAVYEKQDEWRLTIAKNLSKEDGIIDLETSAQILSNQIRGLWSWPGAQCDFQAGATGKLTRVIIANAAAVESQGAAGKKTGQLDAAGNIICGQGSLRITQIKPAGKGLMDFKSFLNGRSTGSDDRFIKIETES